MKGLWRCHYLLQEVLQLLVEKDHEHTLALLVQGSKALHQVALDRGSWQNAALFLPPPDPLGESLFGRGRIRATVDPLLQEVHTRPSTGAHKRRQRRRSSRGRSGRWGGRCAASKALLEEAQRGCSEDRGCARVNRALNETCRDEYSYNHFSINQRGGNSGSPNASQNLSRSSHVQQPRRQHTSIFAHTCFSKHTRAHCVSTEHSMSPSPAPKQTDT